jgi:hypothetical protein
MIKINIKYNILQTNMIKIDKLNHFKDNLNI